ncbi:unnamed protein product [Linum trigynum]|uniref:Endonuclease/exonuclease/phosphatase domain-containing protein n=1 Tax=Linum trigynum TaxID=586398 RepID=A0AAV2CAC4_9ROSI
MSSSLIIWNVRGLGNPEKRGRIKHLIRRQSPKIVGLIETKWEVYSDSLVSSVSGRRDFGWIAKDVVRSSGGIVVSWDKVYFSLLSSREGSSYLDLYLWDILKRKAWHLIVVYDPQGRSEKLLFINELNELCSLLTSPACFAGDFNLVRSHEDYQGS